MHKDLVHVISYKAFINLLQIHVTSVQKQILSNSVEAIMISIVTGESVIAIHMLNCFHLLIAWSDRAASPGCELVMQQTKSYYLLNSNFLDSISI